MATQIPAVAQFSLPPQGQSSNEAPPPVQGNGTMPSVAQFQLPQSSTAQPVPTTSSFKTFSPGLDTIVGNPAAKNIAALPSAIGGAVNAALPITGDIVNGIQGKNTKSAEQIGGDVLKSGANIGIGASALLAPELTGPALIGSSAGLGAAQSAGKAMQQNAPAFEVAKQGAMGGVTGGTTAGILSGASSALNALAGKSVSLAVRPTAKDFADGYDSQFAVDNGLTGNTQQIADKTKAFMQGLTSKLKSVLGNADAGIDLASVFDKTKGDLTSQSGLESNFLQNSQIQKALQTLEDNVLKVNPTGSLPLPSAQTIKQTTGMYGEWLNGAPDPDANAMATVANAFYHNLKTEIENAVPEGPVSEINKQIQKAIPIMRAAIRRIPVTERANALSMTDMLSVLGFPLNPTMAVAAPTFQHAMNSGVMSKIAPAISKAIPRVTGAISALAPNAINSIIPSR